jgi:hypothetical protein
MQENENQRLFTTATEATIQAVGGGVGGRHEKGREYCSLSGFYARCTHCPGTKIGCFPGEKNYKMLI